MSVYSDRIRDHYEKPRNAGSISDPSGKALVRSPVDSDTVLITLRIEHDVIKDVKFKCMGCAVAIACSSVATEMVRGKSVAEEIEEEGIQLVDSTRFLKPLLPEPGVLTRRAPNEHEVVDIEYGLRVARHIAAMDIGQTVVIADRACVAVEAMEGTDQTIARAARFAQGKPLVVVKVSKPEQDMRFDVPVVGLPTVEAMMSAGATALALDARRTLLFERDQLIERANAAEITIQAVPPAPTTEPKTDFQGMKQR